MVETKIADKLAKLENLRNDQVMPIVTLGIGKGNLGFAFDFHDAVHAYMRDGKYPLKQPDVICAEDYMLEGMRTRFAFTKKLQALAASNMLADAGYILFAGKRKKPLFTTEFIKPLIDVINKRTHPFVVCTQTDLAVLFAGAQIPTVVLVADYVPKASLLQPNRISTYLTQTDIATLQLQKAHLDARVVNVGPIVHPVIIDSFEQQNTRRQEKFTAGDKPLNVIDVSSGGGTDYDRCMELINGCKSQLFLDRLNLALWVGEDVVLATRLLEEISRKPGHSFVRIIKDGNDEKLHESPFFCSPGFNTSITILCSESMINAINLLNQSLGFADIVISTGSEMLTVAKGAGIPFISHSIHIGKHEIYSARAAKKEGFVVSEIGIEDMSHAGDIIQDLLRSGALERARAHAYEAASNTKNGMLTALDVIAGLTK